MQYASPQPLRITRPREGDTGRVRRTVAHTIKCPRCGERKSCRTVALARTWLYSHDCVAPCDV